MTFFRNKFDEEFLYLCNNQVKGAMKSIDWTDFYHFFLIRYFDDHTTMHILPLILFNRIESSHEDDVNVEDYLMICHVHDDTVINAYWDDDYKRFEDRCLCEIRGDRI